MHVCVSFSTLSGEENESCPWKWCVKAPRALWNGPITTLLLPSFCWMFQQDLLEYSSVRNFLTGHFHRQPESLFICNFRTLPVELECSWRRGWWRPVFRSWGWMVDAWYLTERWVSWFLLQKCTKVRDQICSYITKPIIMHSASVSYSHFFYLMWNNRQKNCRWGHWGWMSSSEAATSVLCPG